MVCFYPVICSVVLNLGTSTIRTIISCDISLKCFYLIIFLCDRLTLIAFLRREIIIITPEKMTKINDIRARRQR